MADDTDLIDAEFDPTLGAPEDLDAPPPLDEDVTNLDQQPPHVAIDPLGGGLLGARRRGFSSGFGLPGPIEEAPNEYADLFRLMTEQSARQRMAILLQLLLEKRLPLARALRMIQNEASTSLEALRNLGAGEESPEEGNGLGPASMFRDLFAAADRQSGAQSRSASLRANAAAADALSRMAARTDDPELRAQLEAKMAPLLETLIPLDETGSTQLLSEGGENDDTTGG